jgi:hypothetical protein
MTKDSPNKKVNPLVHWWQQRQFYWFRDSFLDFVSPVYILTVFLWALVYYKPYSWIPFLIIDIVVSMVGVRAAYMYSRERERDHKEKEMRQEKRSQTLQTLFVAFIKNDDFTYEAHIVNPTSLAFNRIQALTWGISGDSDGLMTTSKGVRELGRLEPHSSLLLETDTRDGLDFVILYHLDLYADYNNDVVLAKFNLPKGHWEYKTTMLSVLNREGMKIDLALRDEPTTIEQEVTSTDMESSYKTNEELMASHIKTK